MPETPAPQQLLCRSDDLRDGGDAVLFEVHEFGRTVSAFAVRHEGVPVAYLNRCAHVPVEMDWQPGRFWDADGRHLICAVHGALYEPADGRCVGGPCRGARLQVIRLAERDGQVYWYPSDRLQPVPA